MAIKRRKKSRVQVRDHDPDRFIIHINEKFGYRWDVTVQDDGSLKLMLYSGDSQIHVLPHVSNVITLVPGDRV